MARLSTDYTRDVATTGSIFGQHNIAGPEAPHRTVTGFNLDSPGKRDNVLAPRRGMVTTQMCRRCIAKHDPTGGLKRRCRHVANRMHFNFDIFEMRFVVCARVESRDLHEAVCRGNVPEKQVSERLVAKDRKSAKMLTFTLTLPRRVGEYRKRGYALL